MEVVDAIINSAYLAEKDEQIEVILESLYVFLRHEKSLIGNNQVRTKVEELFTIVPAALKIIQMMNGKEEKKIDFKSDKFNNIKSVIDSRKKEIIEKRSAIIEKNLPLAPSRTERMNILQAGDKVMIQEHVIKQHNKPRFAVGNIVSGYNGKCWELCTIEFIYTQTDYPYVGYLVTFANHPVINSQWLKDHHVKVFNKKNDWYSLPEGWQLPQPKKPQRPRNYRPYSNKIPIYKVNDIHVGEIKSELVPEAPIIDKNKSEPVPEAPISRQPALVDDPFTEKNISSEFS